MTRDERDRFADLFHRLIRAGQSSEEEADTESALRLLSHSLLNYLGAAGTEATGQVGDALPWMAAFLDWTRGDADASEVSRRLARSSAVVSLSEPMIRRRLSGHPTGAEAEGIARAPHAEGSNDAHVAVMSALAETEDALASLLELPDGELRDALLEDSGTVAAVLELCEDAADNVVSRRMAERFDSWRHDEAADDDARRSHSLWVLAGLEADDGTRNPLSESGFELSRRARNFERGLAQNMARLQLIGAVRAALAFGPAPGSPATLADHEERVGFLRQFESFRADSALLELTSALIEVRWLALDYMSGGAPLSSLSPWIDYLRGPCAELAEVRECTLREAMSYAHYCLHLMNVCDLAARGPQAFNDKTREALSNLEEELKEFALAGQREGLSDAQANLGRFERSRWQRAGDASYLADRLSRLRGAWRAGTTPGPIGSPPQLDPDVTAHSLALVESLAGQTSDNDISSLARLVEGCRLVDYRWLEHLAPAHILKLVAIAATTARDLAHVDVSSSFGIDLGPLGDWATDPERGQLNRRILAALLDRRSVEDILHSGLEPSALRHGIVGESARGVEPGGRVVMQFIADPELKALLELMGTTTAESDDFRAVLEARLHEILGRPEPRAEISEADDDPSFEAPEATAGSARTV